MTPCIEHTGCKLPGGYGVRFWRGKTRLAHRVAYAEYHNRPVPTLGPILHACDNRACVNPDHLRESTQADNCKDRSLRAPRHVKLKLTVEQVLSIRASLLDKDTLAEQYHVSERTVRAIKAGTAWRAF